MVFAGVDTRLLGPNGLLRIDSPTEAIIAEYSLEVLTLPAQPCAMRRRLFAIALMSSAQPGLLVLESICMLLSDLWFFYRTAESCAFVRSARRSKHRSHLFQVLRVIHRSQNLYSRCESFQWTRNCPCIARMFQLVLDSRRSWGMAVEKYATPLSQCFSIRNNVLLYNAV